MVSGDIVTSEMQYKFKGKPPLKECMYPWEALGLNQTAFLMHCIVARSVSVHFAAFKCFLDEARFDKWAALTLPRACSDMTFSITAIIRCPSKHAFLTLALGSTLFMY